MTEPTTDMSNEDYHKHLAIGASGLKLLNKTPLHYWARYLDPNREREEPTAAMLMGTAIHCAILEPEQFAKLYTVVPEGIDKRSKDGKALFADIEANGLRPLKPADHKTIIRVRDSALAHPVSKLLFSHTEHKVETSIFWKDRVTGVQCKIRPDFMLPPCAQFPNGLIMDVKSTGDASAGEFARQSWNLDMPIQSALYCDGFMEEFKTDAPPPFLWLACEKDAPSACAYYSADAELIAYGRKENRRLLAIYAECLSDNVWPGYPLQITSLELPAWAQKTVQNSLSSAN